MVLFKKLSFNLLKFLFLVSFCSCAVQQEELLFTHQTALNSSPASKPESHKIQPEDLLQIRNLQNPKYIIDVPGTTSAASGSANSGELSYQVAADGTVALPVIGRIQIAGLTRMQATKKIEELYAKEIKAPIIDLKIINLKVTVLGEVNSQGSYPLLKDQTSLVEALGAAGGLTANADSKNLKIIRGHGDEQQVIAIDLSNINSLSDQRTYLQNNDVIYISKSKQTAKQKKVTNLSAILQPVVLILNTALLIYTLAK